MGLYTSLALDENDNPHISYYRKVSDTRGWLKYARYDGRQWVIEKVDSGWDLGLANSIALDGDGNPHISYYDASNKDLRYATGSIVKEYLISLPFIVKQ